MPITDVEKKQLAQKKRLFFKICLKCSTRNNIDAVMCGKCRGSQLRNKNRALGVKK